MKVIVNSVDTTVKVRVDNVTNKVIAKVYQGRKGEDGDSATVTVGTTTTGAAGTDASVTNSGTTSAAVFDFTIPRGDTGPAGPNAVTSATTSDGTAELDIDTLTVQGNMEIAGNIVSNTENSQVVLQGGGLSGFSSPNYYALASNSASLREGNSSLACLTWGAGGGQNLTIPSGTGVALNATSYTYGTGAAAAHVTALGLPATGDIVTLTGSQTLTNKTLTTPTIAQINGSTSASGTLTLNSTTHATKGKIIFGSASAYDQVNDRFAIGTTTPTYPMEVVRSTASTADADVPQILLHNLNTSSTAFAIMRVKIGTGYTGGYPDIFLQASGGTGGVVSIRGVSNHAMRFLTNDTARMTIASSGEVGIGTTSPSTKAVLDLTSTAKGFLPPRMTTTQRDAITSVPAGLMVYNTTTNKINFYNGSAWEAVTSA